MNDQIKIKIETKLLSQILNKLITDPIIPYVERNINNLLKNPKIILLQNVYNGCERNNNCWHAMQSVIGPGLKTLAYLFLVDRRAIGDGDENDGEINKN